VFIDRFDGFMLYPFFALYLTKFRGVGSETEPSFFGAISTHPTRY
jgi:hypothetical protein